MVSAEQPSTRIPGPRELYTLDTGPDSFRAMGALVREFGPMVQVRSGDRAAPSLIVVDPEAIQRVLVTNARNYVKGVGFERVKMLLGNGIIVSDGAFWRRQRTMIQPAFSRSNVERFAQIICECNRRLRDGWLALAARGAVVDVTAATSGYALEVILRCLFGEDYDRMRERSGTNPFGFLTDEPARDLQAAVRFRGLRGLMQSIIDARRADGCRSQDLLGRLMAARDKKTGEAMSDGELLDEMMTLIIAGHETSASTLNWSWYLLSQHPEVAQRLCDEITAVTGGEAPEVAQLSELRFARQVLDETLRLYPPVWVFTRKALDDDILSGHPVAAGTDLFISPYLVQRDPAHWDAPGEFRPQRFADEALRSRNRYAFIPFSAGSRRCTGEYFAYLEMQSHLAMLVPHVRLEYASEGPPEVSPGVNLRSRDPLHMRLAIPADTS